MTDSAKLHINLKPSVDDQETILNVRFDKFWSILSEQLDDANATLLRGIVFNAVKQSGICESGHLVIVSRPVEHVTNFNRFYRAQNDVIKSDPSMTGAKARRDHISKLWKAMSKEEKAKWANDSGTAEVVEKKSHSNGYNLFTRENYKRLVDTTQPANMRFKPISDAWKVLSEEERAEWNARARQESGPYVRKNTKTRQLKEKSEFKPKGSKRVSGYNLFIKSTSSELRSRGEKMEMSAVGSQWKVLTPEQQADWNVQAKALNDVAATEFNSSKTDTTAVVASQ